MCSTSSSSELVEDSSTALGANFTHGWQVFALHEQHTERVGQADHRSGHVGAPLGEVGGVESAVPIRVGLLAQSRANLCQSTQGLARQLLWGAEGRDVCVCVSK